MTVGSARRQCLLPLLFMAFLSLFASPSRAYAVQVKEVRVEGLYSISREELLYLLDIKPGDVLETASVRRGIKRAFLKGIFEDIAVEADDVEKGVIWVKVIERDVIDDIDIEGNSYLSKKFIKRQLDLSEGSMMRYDLLDDVRDRLLQAMREKGLPFAHASIEVVRTDEPYRVEVLVRVVEGSPLYVHKIEVYGRPKEEVAPLMRVKVGSTYDQFKLRDDLKRIAKYYSKRGYFNPEVGPYTYKDGELDLGVYPGKRLSIRIQGNEAVGTGKLRRSMPFFEVGDVSDELVEEAVSKMVLLYHEKGYPSVQVAPVVERNEEEIIMNFYIFEGSKVRVSSLAFTGITIPEKNLKEIMSMKEGDVYNPDLLDSDMRNIKEFYTALGHLDVSVAEPQVEMSEAGASILIEVKEGPRFEVARLGIEGVKSVPEEEVRKAAGIKAGDPYNEVDVVDARRRVISLYRNRGFPDCRVIVSRKFEGNLADVVFSVDEGPMVFFGKTVITGNTSTRPEVIEREFLHSQGEPFDATQLVEERQKLYRLGLFTEVDTRILDRYDETSDVEVVVTEGKAGSVEFGLGYGEYEKYRGFFDLGYRNLFGMNRQASFRTELSSLTTRFILSYREPWFLGKPMPFRAILLREDRKEKNVDTGDIRYRVKRHSASVGIEKKLSDKTKLDLFYEFSLVETFDVQPDVILSKEDTGTLAISSITPSIAYDTRDNPFDPQRGVFASLSVKSASYLLLSETDFIKVIARASRYMRLSRWLVLAASLRGGVAEGLRDTDELPIVERFFLGGRDTVRGFNQDTLGPKGDLGTPVGGNAFLLGNLEFRIKVYDGWKLVTFLDAGNVYPKIGDVDPTDLRYTAGLGLRYSTPVGPVRVDYGHKLNRKPGESSGEIHFSIGQAF
jgi:outer membrane protein insertion porin family